MRITTRMVAMAGQRTSAATSCGARVSCWRLTSSDAVALVVVDMAIEDVSGKRRRSGGARETGQADQTPGRRHSLLLIQERGLHGLGASGWETGSSTLPSRRRTRRSEIAFPVEDMASRQANDQRREHPWLM